MILLKHGDRTPGQEELPRDHEEKLVLYYGVVGGLIQGEVSSEIFIFPKKTLGILEA